MIKESEVQKAYDLLRDPREAATARAKHEFYENHRRVLRADIVKELRASGMGVTEAEATAAADERYKKHLEEQRRWAYKDYWWRTRIDGAKAILDGYRTFRADQRGMDRIG